MRKPFDEALTPTRMPQKEDRGGGDINEVRALYQKEALQRKLLFNEVTSSLALFMYTTT